MTFYNSVFERLDFIYKMYTVGQKQFLKRYINHFISNYNNK